MVPLKDHVTLVLWHYDTMTLGEAKICIYKNIRLRFRLILRITAQKMEALIFKASGTSG